MANSALIDDLRKQFAENPRRVFARLANEFRKRGELDSAIEICRSHVPLQPGYISGHIVLGQALYDSGSLDEARVSFETALALDPENLIALRHMGEIAHANGDGATARAWYHQLLEIDPQNDEVAARLEALVADTDSAAQLPSAPRDEAAGWGEVNPEAIALDYEEALAETATPPAEPTHAIAPPDAEATPIGEGEAVELDDSPTELGEAESVRVTVAPLFDADAFDDSFDDSSAASSDDAAPAAFATETMAELYLQQGFADRAIAIYRELADRDPADPSLRERLTELEAVGETAPESEAVETSARTAREFFGALAYRRAPREIVLEAAALPAGESSAFSNGQRESSEPSNDHGESLEPSIDHGASSGSNNGQGAGHTGTPGREAASALSLDDVFRDAPADGEPRSRGGLSFDEFFARRDGAGPADHPDAAVATKVEESGAGEESSSDGDPTHDLELFHAWLDGLKG